MDSVSPNGTAAKEAKQRLGAADPNVPSKRQRRRFSIEDKARIVREADACGPGMTGALLGRENAKLGGHFIAETMRKEGIVPGQVVLHSDRGTPMTAKPTAALLDALGVGESHSRPHVSDDNPFSEAHFKTFKYHPTFPERFGSIEDTIALCENFFRSYNNDHRLASSLRSRSEAGSISSAADAVLIVRSAVGTSREG